MTFGRSDPDLIVFALKQLHEDIDRLGDIALDSGKAIGEGFVLDFFECCFAS
jgi:hypothetical protein